MVKGVFKRLTPEDKLCRIFKTKNWKDNLVIDNITINILQELCCIVKEWDVIYHIKVVHIATLCSFNDTIIDFYNEYYTIPSSKRKARCKLNYILYYGKAEGIKRWLEYNKNNNISYKKKLILKYGETEGIKRWLEYKQILSEKQKERYKNTTINEKRKYSCRCIEYWLSKGYSVDDAKEVISKMQSKSSLKRHEKMTPVDYRKNNPMCEEYWLSKGYSVDESMIMKQPYLDNFIMTKDNFIRLHDNGEQKWNDMISKRKKSMKSYISNNHAMFGVASKESLRYFIPLYRKIRTKYNIDRKDIYFGVKGSMEYFIGHGKSYYYMYDFTISSKRIIIEYNNLRWHPHPIKMNVDEWNNWNIHGMNAQNKYDYDRIKIETAINHGFDVLVIWSCDSKEYNFNKIEGFINEHI